MSLLIETDGPMGHYVEDWLVVLDRECCSAAQVSIPTTGRDPKPDVVGICLAAQALGEARCRTRCSTHQSQCPPQLLPGPKSTWAVDDRGHRVLRACAGCGRHTHTHTKVPRW